MEWYLSGSRRKEKKLSAQNFSENMVQKHRQTKDFYQTKTEKIYCQKSCTLRHDEESSSGRNKMIPDGNLGLHKKRKSIRNKKSMANTNDIFS